MNKSSNIWETGTLTKVIPKHLHLPPPNFPQQPEPGNQEHQSVSGYRGYSSQNDILLWFNHIFFWMNQMWHWPLTSDEKWAEWRVMNRWSCWFRSQRSRSTFQDRIPARGKTAVSWTRHVWFWFRTNTIHQIHQLKFSFLALICDWRRKLAQTSELIIM